MTARSTAEQVADLCNALVRARGAIAAGTCVDLSGLDDEIARLMDAALLAPPADHPQLRAGIETLLNEIDNLDIVLQRHHDADTALRAKGAYTPKVATR
jgi:hypothetical protein